MQRTPVDGLNRCLVVRKLGKRLCACGLPNEELVVVTARSQLVFVMQTPPEPTDLLPVLVKPHVRVTRLPQVSHEDGAILGARGDHRSSHIAPSQRAHPVGVADEAPHFLLVVDVPDLHLA